MEGVPHRDDDRVAPAHQRTSRRKTRRTTKPNIEQSREDTDWYVNLGVTSAGDLSHSSAVQYWNDSCSQNFTLFFEELILSILLSVGLGDVFVEGAFEFDAEGEGN